MGLKDDEGSDKTRDLSLFWCVWVGRCICTVCGQQVGRCGSMMVVGSGWWVVGKQWGTGVCQARLGIGRGWEGWRETGGVGSKRQ
ncbi:hypothetical protein CGRA01v4_01779 [Colletotrichum graminicola]|nr:hypothetical protein CGRA01v4_01779 [Colletotrichum graminicola]